MTLKISLSSGAPDQFRADVLVLLLSKAKLSEDANFRHLDQCLGGKLQALCVRADFTGRVDQLLDVATLGNLGAEKLLLVGVGDEQPPSEAKLRHLVATAVRSCTNAGAAHVAVWLPWKSDPARLRTAAEGVMLGSYRFIHYFTGERRTRKQVTQVTFLQAGRATVAAKAAVERGRRIGLAVCIARDAVNEPPNTMTPPALAQLAAEVARRGHLKVRVLDEKAIDRMGMQLLAAVGRGSEHGPKFVHLTYTPKTKAKKRIVFLGKGLTFDSGGLCIKPPAGMPEMKSDMAGAAAVIGLMAAVAELKPQVEIHGLLVVAENMPDGRAYRPGDVFTSLDGKTVEIINTDAEGRLTLADGLAYARRLNPDLIVEASTLTGACMVALGKTTSAFYSTSDDWASRFATAAEQAGESFWRMPLLAELRDQLKSDIADLKHTGDRWGGSITAALFLKEFAGTVPFIHCDIAGPALSDRSKGVVSKGGTGHPVLTFVRFVEALP